MSRVVVSVGLVCSGILSLLIAWITWMHLGADEAYVGIVVPHHDMVADTRLAFLQEVAAVTNAETIIVISPDHFNAAARPIVASDRVWETAYGAIMPDTERIAALGIPVHREAFVDEHGITSLLSDFKTVFPTARIIPIIVQRNASYAEVMRLTDALYATCAGCLLVASVDFSHTNVASVAALHDRGTLRDLKAQRGEALYQFAEVDSPEALAALARWGELHQAPRFTLFSHTNSGHLSGVPTGEMTTHIIGGYHRGKSTPSSPVTTFMIGGDTMFARAVAASAARPEEVFTPLGERFFWGVDMSVLNLEGVFTDEVKPSGVADEFPPKLLFETRFREALQYLRVGYLSVANNHGLDGAAYALDFTRSFLAEQGFIPFGDPLNQPGFRVVNNKTGDIPVSIVSVAAHHNFDGIEEEITSLTEVQRKVIVFAHWGSEYEQSARDTERAMARRWIDAGAALVVGSHPHVVQDVEVYRGVPIVYSLGNFLFDQREPQATMVGAVLAGAFEAEGLRLTLVPVNTYLRPSVFPVVEHTAYLRAWTAPFTDHAVGDEYFYFPYLAE